MEKQKQSKYVDIHSRSNSRNSDNDHSSNDIPREQEVLVKELTPELADKIWKGAQKKMYDDKVSKEAVLHHLKQLKAQMGKLKITESSTYDRCYNSGITDAMEAVDKKIAKIKKQ
jgi:hypothetical protein